MPKVQHLECRNWHPREASVQKMAYSLELDIQAPSKRRGLLRFRNLTGARPASPSFRPSIRLLGMTGVSGKPSNAFRATLSATWSVKD